MARGRKASKSEPPAVHKAPAEGMVRVQAPAHLVGSGVDGQTIPASGIVELPQATALALIGRHGWKAAD